MNAPTSHSFLAEDRAYERQGEHDDQFDAAVAAEARLLAAALIKEVSAGSQEVVSDLVDEWAHRVSQPGVTEKLLQLAARNPLAAGQMVANLLQLCIDDAAEVAAVKLVEQH